MVTALEQPYGVSEEDFEMEAYKIKSVIEQLLCKRSVLRPGSFNYRMNVFFFLEGLTACDNEDLCISVLIFRAQKKRSDHQEAWSPKRPLRSSPHVHDEDVKSDGNINPLGFLSFGLNMAPLMRRATFRNLVLLEAGSGNSRIRPGSSAGNGSSKR
jgi:hypothetical protein